MIDSKQGKFWVLLGKAGALLTFIWLIIQMVTYFSKPKEYKLEVSGNHYIYKTPDSYLAIMNEYNKIKSLDKSYVESVNKNSLPISDLIRFEKSAEADKNYIFKSRIENYTSEYGRIIKWESYNEIWTFNIENTGAKPVEDLLVEIPFKGFYEVNKQKGNSTKGVFDNRIQIGTLAPGYSVSITTWVDDMYSTEPEFNEEKTRITHKYGWQSINYPVKADGIIAWNIKNGNNPLIVLIFIIIIIIAFAFGVGVDYFGKSEPLLRQSEPPAKVGWICM
jgi:hypothetical protein